MGRTERYGALADLPKHDALAVRALDESRTRLMMAHRFLDRALWQMPAEPAPVPDTASAALEASAKPLATNGAGAKPLATNGARLFFNAQELLVQYRGEPDRVVRGLVHSVLHCMFHHPFRTVRAEPRLWEVACDICVEASALELCRTRFALPEDERTEALLRQLEDAGIAIAPAPLYRTLLLAARNPQENPWLGEYATASDASGFWFARDGHDFWNLVRPGTDAGDGQDEPEGSSAGAPSPDIGAQGGEGTPDADDPGAAPPDVDGEPADEAPAFPPDVPEDAEQAWRDIAQQVATEMRSMDEQQGRTAGNLASNLELANRSRIDYEDFLRRFSRPVEEVRTNDEEFDYIFYTYGLSTYGNMPIIEPLEYREAERLREFVIAVDTSGSCSGELVRLFLTRTCEILGQAHLSGEATSIHIVQADAAVQDDAVITSEADLRAYMRDMQVLGGGGTDFRPVFDYVEELRAQGQLTGLRGMVYFTDGIGTFPQRMPDYDVAFAFVEDEGRQRKVPPWAMKVVLGQDDIQQLGAAGGAPAADWE